MKLYIFKENLIQLLLISESIWNTINASKASTNIFNLFIISFSSETNIQLEIRPNVEFANFNGTKKTLNKIFIQKSNYYDKYEKGFVSFNVIGYNLGGIWYSVSEYYKNQNYDKLTIISGFKGNIITKPSVKKILFKLKFISQQAEMMENQNINIDNLIYFSNKKNYFGYTNDTKNEITCFPLIRPFSDITVTAKLENIDENKSQIIYFENNTSFIIPSISLNEKIKIKNIDTRTMRITDNIGENLLLNFSTVGSNQNLYNLDYNYNNSYYKLKFNIISLKFVTNRNEGGGESDQSDNKILINKHTNNINNNQILEENSDFSGNLFNWGTQLPLITNHSYLEQRVVGITKEELNNVDFNYKDLNFKLLVQNKNSSIIDIYIQNYSSLAVKKILQNTSNFGKVDLSNNILQIIPKAKNNMDGEKAFIGYQVLETNYDIFNNLIIPDTYVEIAGIQSNVEKVLINLNRNFSGKTATYSTNITLNVIDNDYYNDILIEDLGLKYKQKNPIISTIKQVLILNYKVYIVDNNVKFERLNVNDNSILDLSGSSSNLSDDNPTFTSLEDEIYNFDISDESNKGNTIKFFEDDNYQIEFLDLSDNGFPYATYSRNHEPGEDGAFIQIITPSKNESKITNSEFYYSLIKKNYFNSLMDLGGGTIKIKGRKTLFHGEIDVENINKTSNSGNLVYSNSKFYDPLSEKEPYNIDLSYNYATILDYFNNYQYQYQDVSGQIDISSSNVKTFTGDNIVNLVENPLLLLNKFDYAFYFTNTNLIHGKIKIGFSTIYNSDLFTTKDPNSTAFPYDNENTKKDETEANNGLERYLKKIPFDLSNVELNGIPNDKNNTDYVVYTTKNFDASMNKTDFLIKYVPEYSDKEYHVDVSFNRFSTGDLSDCSQNIFLAGDISNNRTYMALVIIKEDLFGISRFEKITNSDASNNSSSTSAEVLLKYKNKPAQSPTSTVPTDISLNVAFVRKKFNFKADISGISHNDNIFLFEPLDYSNNVLNHDLNYNEYVVGMFDTSNLDKISMCKIKLQQTEQFYINTNNSGIVVDNSIITSKWISGNFGLYETKPRDLVLKYKNDFQQFINSRRNDIELSNFKLPLFDSNTFNEFTVEIEYFKCWENNSDAKITYRINQKNKENSNGFKNLTELVIPQTDVNFKPHEEQIMNIDPFGVISINNINSGSNFIGENLNGKERKYKVTYQVENYLTNNVLYDISTNKLYDFTRKIFTTQEGKTILNMKYLNIPLKSTTYASKNEFNIFLNSNPTGNVLNTLINKQNPIKIIDIKYQDTDLSSAQLSYTGIGYINYTTKEKTKSKTVEMAYDPSGAYSNLSGNQIYFNIVDVQTITNLNSIIRNEKDVYLYWDFKNDNLSVNVKFNIYRSQNPTNKEYILIAATANKYYTDSRAIPYLTVDYKVESVIVWENIEMVTGSEETKNFICENNTFEYGRYNNTTKNVKLYQPINTSCQKIGMTGIATTGNLFPNSQVLTKSQIYSTLSRAKFRPFR